MRYDAVMIGSGTALADDPDLTVRGLGAGHQPVRIVVDGGLRFSPDSRLGRGAADHPVWILCSDAAEPQAKRAWDAVGAELIFCPNADGHLNIEAGLRILAAKGITRVFCEGGAGLAAALIRAGLVDELVCFTAGALIGEDGRAALGPLGLTSLGNAPRLRLLATSPIGADTTTTWGFD